MRRISQRGYMLGGALVFALVAAFALATSTLAIPGVPGPWKIEPNCVQPPPQSVRDHATFSDAELQLYGMPKREPGEPFDHWAKIVRSMNTRSCQYRELPGVIHGGSSLPQRP